MKPTKPCSFICDHAARCEAHYAHAKAKHPYFCDWVAPQGKTPYEIKTKIAAALLRARRDIRDGINDHMLGWDDLLMAFDSEEFRDFCKARKDRTVRKALDAIDMYAQVYGWFRIGDDKQWGYRKGAPFEQNIRVAKTVAAVANAKAREEAAKRAAKKSKPKEGDDAQ